VSLPLVIQQALIKAFQFEEISLDENLVLELRLRWQTVVECDSYGDEGHIKSVWITRLS